MMLLGWLAAGLLLAIVLCAVCMAILLSADFHNPER